MLVVGRCIARRRVTVLLALVAAVVAAGSACAQDYPSRPIRVLVPAAAGGPSDIGARLAAEALGRALNVPVFVENRRGGVSVIESYVAGELDGYTILEAALGSLTFIPAAKHVAYDAEKDFVPLGTVWRSALMLTVRPGLGVSTLAEFVAAAKARPAAISIASAGVGTTTHLTIELLKREAGIDLIHVPYRSSGEGLTPLLGGQVDALFCDVQIFAPQVRSGSIRALAIAGPSRAPVLPDIPTMSEAGLPGVVGETWFGFVVSAKTPPAVVKRLQEALAVTHDDPIYRDNLARQGVSAGERGPESFARLIKVEAAKWRKIVAAAGIKLD